MCHTACQSPLLAVGCPTGTLQQSRTFPIPVVQCHHGRGCLAGHPLKEPCISAIHSQVLCPPLLTFLATPWAVVQESHSSHHNAAVVGAEVCSGSGPALHLAKGLTWPCFYGESLVTATAVHLQIDLPGEQDPSPDRFPKPRSFLTGVQWFLTGTSPARHWQQHCGAPIQTGAPPPSPNPNWLLALI